MSAITEVIRVNCSPRPLAADLSRLLRCTIVSVCWFALVGCALLESDEEATYETISAAPGHDTETAIKQHEKALKIIQRYLDGKPHHSDLAKAEEHLQAALVADITYGPAHNTLGMLYYWQRKLYLAAWEYQYAAKLMPDKLEPLYNLGMVYESAKNLDQALMYYEMAYQLDPQNPYVIGNLARARVRSGETVDMVRPLLQDTLLYDTRPGWITWATRQIELNPHCLVDYESISDENGSVDWNGGDSSQERPLVPPAPEPLDKDKSSPPGVLRIPPVPDPLPEPDSPPSVDQPQETGTVVLPDPEQAEPLFQPPLLPPVDDES
ncbi:hypothetical protein [Symmachiella dynata]|uniref:hypothetical protein n=1 Tax=Symmachiella dynata TaxID=2527995 RepID=UPI0030ECF003